MEAQGSYLTCSRVPQLLSIEPGFKHRFIWLQNHCSDSLCPLKGHLCINAHPWPLLQGCGQELFTPSPGGVVSSLNPSPPAAVPALQGCNLLKWGLHPSLALVCKGRGYPLSYVVLNKWINEQIRDYIPPI